MSYLRISEKQPLKPLNPGASREAALDLPSPRTGTDGDDAPRLTGARVTPAPARSCRLCGAASFDVQDRLRLGGLQGWPRPWPQNRAPPRHGGQGRSRLRSVAFRLPT